MLPVILTIFGLTSIAVAACRCRVSLPQVSTGVFHIVKPLKGLGRPFSIQDLKEIRDLNKLRYVRPFKAGFPPISRQV